MRCSTKYVGLDVHQATTSATVRDSSGKIIARSVLPTEEAALLEFFAGIRGAVRGAFEEGTQAQWLHDLFAPWVARVARYDQALRPVHGFVIRRMPHSILRQQYTWNQQIAFLDR